MTTPKENKAALLTSKGRYPLEVGPGGDHSELENDDVVIKVAAVAINPSEWKMQEYEYMPFKYPKILGSDVAGTVAAIGSSVKRFKPGNRVIGHCLGLVHDSKRYGGFQNFAACSEIMTAMIPDDLGFERAVVLPLSISTATTGLYEQLELQLPPFATDYNADVKRGAVKHEAVVIWGGSSSVGSTAIQLAAASGYFVITTASPRNYDYVRSLAPGSSIEVFDHSHPQATDRIIEYIKQNNLKFKGAYDCIGEGKTEQACGAIVSAFGGGVFSTVLLPAKDLPEGVTSVMSNAGFPATKPGHPGAKLWESFVYQALKDGTLQPKPDPKVVGHGLEKIQEAMDIQKKGVSASKIVVLL